MNDFEIARPTHSKLLDMIDSGEVCCETMLKNLLDWLPEDDVKQFAEDYEYVEDEVITDNDIIGYYLEEIYKTKGWVDIPTALDVLQNKYNLYSVSDSDLIDFAEDNDIRVIERHGTYYLLTDESMTIEDFFDLIDNEIK